MDARELRGAPGGGMRIAVAARALPPFAAAVLERQPDFEP